MESSKRIADTESCHVVFNVNYGGLAGLGSTLISMIHNCREPERLMLHIMCSDLADQHKVNIDKILSDDGFRGKYRYIDYSANEEFRSLPPLLGDLTTYGRLLIADHVQEPKVVYLDSDLVVACDITEMYDTDLGDHLIGAVTRGTLVTAYDGKFFFDRGLPPTMDYFNAGVLLMNLAKWRADNVEGRWRSLLAGDVKDLRAHDQTTLNYLCQGEFLRLPIAYNTPFLAHDDRESRQFGILHFIGSPKPWDFLGNLIHQGYDVWEKHNPAYWSQKYLKFDQGRVKRSWQIRRSLVRSALRWAKG